MIIINYMIRKQLPGMTTPLLIPLALVQEDAVAVLFLL